VGLESTRGALGAAESLPDGLRDAFMARARSMKVRRGHIIMSEGDEAADVYLICNGKVQVSLLSPQGREIILRDLSSGHVFGETGVIDGLPRSANIVALEDSLLARMAGAQFLDFIDSVPGMGLWMARLLTARLRDLTERAFELATLPVAARVHSELLRLALESEGSGDHAFVHQMPKHADLAARIGTHREAVTRELNSLANDGILRQSGRQVEILSIAKLRSLYDRMRR
jgi:CRP/FNR family transcriptional regulator, cyclic AMP receptor protein